MPQQLPLLEDCSQVWEREWGWGRWKESWPFIAHPSLLECFPLSLSSQSLLSRFVDGLTFKVNFTFNRQPLRVQHRARELTGRWPLEPMLFPVASRGVPLLPSDVKLK